MNEYKTTDDAQSNIGSLPNILAGARGFKRLKLNGIIKKVIHTFKLHKTHEKEYNR